MYILALFGGKKTFLIKNTIDQYYVSQPTYTDVGYTSIREIVGYF